MTKLYQLATSSSSKVVSTVLGLIPTSSTMGLFSSEELFDGMYGVHVSHKQNLLEFLIFFHILQ